MQEVKDPVNLLIYNLQDISRIFLCSGKPIHWLFTGSTLNTHTISMLFSGKFHDIYRNLKSCEFIKIRFTVYLQDISMIFWLNFPDDFNNLQLISMIEYRNLQDIYRVSRKHRLNLHGISNIFTCYFQKVENPVNEPLSPKSRFKGYFHVLVNQFTGYLQGVL